MATHLLPQVPYADRLYLKKCWIFQQDSAPSNQTKLIQAWLHLNFLYFIMEVDRSPSSPDSNLLDHCVLWILGAKVNSTKVLTLSKIPFWLNGIDYLFKMVPAAVGQWHNRLSLVINKVGGRFEWNYFLVNFHISCST